VPENKFTKDQKVTLRRLLSHSAGLTVHGFPGYAVGKPVPTLLQVLDGASPANTRAIRVDFEPGSKLRYSGGGYTVMQQLIVDITREPFDRFMQQAVLDPLKMTNSSYAQPLPADQAALAATGYYSGGKAVEGKWHLYPEMAAAGLWTTASDLAKFALAIQQTIAGSTNGIISPSMARQMVTNQSESDGLGVFLLGEGQTQRFVHNGRDEGFDAVMMAYAHRGQGAVILINANDNTGALARIIEAVAHAYHWPDFK
jgi:CubicO group peptidase (beta-lactamase class C family)